MLILKILTLVSFVLFVSTTNVWAFFGLSLCLALSFSEKMNLTHLFHSQPAYKFSKNYFNTGA